MTTERPPVRRPPTAGLMSTPELAEASGIPVQTLWGLARSGEGLVLGDSTVRPIKAGRRVWWPRAPIMAAMGVTDE